MLWLGVVVGVYYRRMANRVLLDAFLPSYDFEEAHEIEGRASPEDAYRAVRAVTPAEVLLLRTLFRLRSAPARQPTGSRIPFGSPEPLIGQALRGGFVLLAEDPGREIALGVIGQFWRIGSGIPLHLADAGAFVAFDRPNFAKAVLGFSVARIPGGGALVCTRTRVRVPDRGARGRFALYWLVIHPASAMIRRNWLRAIKRRAEGG